MDKEYLELEKEFENIVNKGLVLKNKPFIPSKPKKETKKDKPSYLVDMEKELEQILKDEEALLKKFEAFEKKRKQLKKENNNQIKKIKGIKKEIKETKNEIKDLKDNKKYEYWLDVKLFKTYVPESKRDATDKKIKRNWEIILDSQGDKYVIMRILMSVQIKNAQISQFQMGNFYNKNDNPNEMTKFSNIFFNSDEKYWKNKQDERSLLQGYCDGFIILNMLMVQQPKYKEPNLKTIKYKDEADKAIYNKYINYNINMDAKLFMDLVDIEYNEYLKKNFRANSCLLTCIINKFYKKFDDRDNKGYRRYKNSLTYDYLCDLLNIPNTPDNIGASINDVMPFFEKYKLGFVVYDCFMKLIHKYEPDKKPNDYMVLRIMVKDNHVYQLNNDLKSLEQIDSIEKSFISNKYHISNKEQQTTNNFKYIVKDLKDILNLTKYHNNFKNLMNDLVNSKIKNQIYIKCIYNNPLNDILIDLVCNHKYVPKVFFNNYVYKLNLKIDYINITIETVDINTQDEPIIEINNIEEYEQLLKVDKEFKENFIKSEYLSTHHESVLEIENEYKIIPISGHIINTNDCVKGLDIRKAYSASLSNINMIPIFSYFDVYKKYNNEPIENYNYYIIEVNDKSDRATILFNQKYSRVYGFLLNNINIEYKILYYRKPFKLEEVDFKTPVNNLYSNEFIDDDIKKYIANKLTGLLELKRNKKNECKLYNDYNQALMNQKLYGGSIVPIIKTSTEQINKIDEFDGGEIISFINKSETKFYLLNVNQEQKLINGFTPIKDIIYCMQKLKLLNMYDKLTTLNIKVIGIKTDCIFFNGSNDIIKNNFDLSNKIGNYKIENGKYMNDNKLYIGENQLIKFTDFENIEVKTFDNEYNTQEINKYLIDNKKVMIKSIYAGCGKSQSIKNLGLPTLFILPENKLCQDIINEKNNKIDAITFSKLFGLYADDIELQNYKTYDLSKYKAVCFDEIAKHSPDRLKRIANFLINNFNLLIYGAGDYRQIAPIHFNGSTKYLDECLNILFPKQILLKQIKRVDNIDEQETIKGIYKYIFEEQRNNIDVVELCNKFNIKMVNKMIDVNTTDNLAYFNFRCETISNHIHYTILKQRLKFYDGLLVVCRKHFKGRGFTLNTNYTYKIKSIKKNVVILEDETNKVLIKIDLDLLNKHFILPYCRTIDSSQGTSISNKITVFDLNLPYVSKEHIWVAITRARSLKNLQIFIHDKQEVKRFNEAKIKQYLSFKIDNYKLQDKKANRDISNNFIDVEFILEQMKKLNNKCCLCLKDIEIFIDADNNIKSDLTIDRKNNNLAHIKTNCQLCCLKCNVSKK